MQNQVQYHTKGNFCSAKVIIIIMKFNFRDKNEYIRLFKFSCVGVINTLIDWIVFFIMSTLLHIAVQITQPVAYMCGVIVSYLGNKFFTFKSNKKVSVWETTKFLIINILSLGASTLVITLLVNKLGWNEYIAKIPATCAAMIINFVGSRFFVFADSINHK